MQWLQGVTVERSMWRNARTLPAYGELVAKWLTGEILYHPARGGVREPGDATRELASRLASASRAGFIPYHWQSAFPHRTRAAVEGFATAETAYRLRVLADLEDLIVIERVGVRSWWEPTRRHTVPITSGFIDRDPSPEAFGKHLGRGDLAKMVCNRDMLTALSQTHQIALIDREWGRNTVLWPTLARFAHDMSVSAER
jgi:hypothetical protein